MELIQWQSTVDQSEEPPLPTSEREPTAAMRLRTGHSAEDAAARGDRRRSSNLRSEVEAVAVAAAPAVAGGWARAAAAAFVVVVVVVVVSVA